MQKADDRPIEVFYSYSHNDEEYRKKLGEHLYVLRRAGLITDWHDREIDAGAAWQEEIDRHLLSADVVLLLVSASFIASDYCWGDEMKKALARHKEKKARVIPIILHPCGWLMTPLQALQGVPRNNKAISLWPNEHAAFHDVVTEIAKVVDDLRRSKTAKPEVVEQTSAVAVVASMPVPKDGVCIGVDPRELPDLAVFRDVDAPWCPAMVVIPAGEFLMGSPPDEEGREDNEAPQHWVSIGYRLAIGRYAITFAEYDHFCEVMGREKPGDVSWGRGSRPVINVTWRDANAYVEWLSGDTGQRYRLPSEAEWECACRAETTTPFSFGQTVTPEQANYCGKSTYAGGAPGAYREKTNAVGRLPANAWGLHDMHGNVWEWVEDNWHDSYSAAPADGAAWKGGDATESDRLRVRRGGSWFNYPKYCRSASRGASVPDGHGNVLGFRVARMLD